MTPHFRLASSADIDLLIAFMRQFYAFNAYPFEEQSARTTMQRIVSDASLGRVWLIYSGDQAVGYIVIAFGYSLEYHGRDAFIDELFVTDSHRGQGLGARTLEFVLETCSDLDIHALHLEVEHTNFPAQRLYREFGFEDHNRSMLTKVIN